MFHFTRYGSYGPIVFRPLYPDITLDGFPHSDIHGSKRACRSPWLIATYYVLHRLSSPRHSPCALSSLITNYPSGSQLEFQTDIFSALLVVVFYTHYTLYAIVKEHPSRSCGTKIKPRKLVGAIGFEPMTLRLSSACSNQLSYAPRRRVAPKLVEPTRVELVTSCLQSRRSTN